MITGAGAGAGAVNVIFFSAPAPAKNYGSGSATLVLEVLPDLTMMITLRFKLDTYTFLRHHVLTKTIDKSNEDGQSVFASFISGLLQVYDA